MINKNKMINRIVFATIRAGLTQIFFFTWCMQSLLGFLRESLFYLRKYHAINVTNRNKNECGRICPFSVLEATYCLNQIAFRAHLLSFSLNKQSPCYDQRLPVLVCMSPKILLPITIS